MIHGKYNFASIDVGSNSINLLLAHFENGKILEERTFSYITELGRGLRETGFFSEDGMERADEAFGKIRKMLDEYGIGKESVICVATEASRVARNASTFYMKIEKIYHIRTEVISANDEAQFSVIGVVAGDKNEMTLIDLGGASTEVLLIKNNTIEKFKSFQIGAVNKSCSFSEDEAVTYLKNGLTEKKIILVGGTAVALVISMLKLDNFDSRKIELSSFSYNEISAFSERLGDMSDDEITDKFPFMAQRSGSIRNGVMHICWFLRQMNPTEIRFSTKGVRHGALLNFIGSTNR